MKRPDPSKKPQLPCPVCGGLSYIWGSVGAHGLNFTPRDASFLNKFFGYGFKMAARACDDCGNVQMFADVALREPD